MKIKKIKWERIYEHAHKGLGIPSRSSWAGYIDRQYAHLILKKNDLFEAHVVVFQRNILDIPSVNFKTLKAAKQYCQEVLMKEIFDLFFEEG
jgi:hypothetical protein